MPSYVESNLYPGLFDKYNVISSFFEFLYSFFDFSEWSATTTSKSWFTELSRLS